MTYEEARKQAQQKANAYQCDVGIERAGGFNPGFRTFLLPKPEHRFGHELTCEVVSPSQETKP